MKIVQFYFIWYTNTPLWPNGPADKPVLCNACGSRYKTRGHLDNYLPKNVHPQPHHKKFKNVNSGGSNLNVEPELESGNQLLNHVSPRSTTNGDSDKLTLDVHHISPQDFGKKIPSKKRSPMVYKRMIPMEKFQKQLVKLYKSERQPEESVLVDNMMNFIPENEIGLGTILLKTNDDDASSTDKCGSSTSAP
ncbi:GATA transcription factor 26 [Glycine max]|nr:GATA transcription factor 26 [Glycine max]